MLRLSLMRLMAGAAITAALGLSASPTLGADVMTPVPKVWVEGPGYDITYGAAYDVCARRCLETPRCRMIEYYRPEKKCNLYDGERPTISGGSSSVAVRRAGKT